MGPSVDHGFSSSAMPRGLCVEVHGWNVSQFTVRGGPGAQCPATIAH
jgi:hypothetical protein